ncbi:YicC/YloC family endoribonuclease [Oribacterium sinus]|uniref:YicC/YloC family endoribonuclease n=1 Tax=Oribacterium sinus TaxID=237576 RepID=UPI0028EC3C01|nr:YicC/YloC family endoribonuclease [Oribacterium sinus]
MSIKSMTGFGRCVGERDCSGITVEIKSVNSRFLDLSIRLPRTMQHLEMKCREWVKERISRGKVEIFVSLEDSTEKKKKLLLREDLLDAYVESIKKVAEKYSLPYNLDAKELVFFPEVAQIVEGEEEDREEALFLAMELAMTEFQKAREKEGSNLKRDILLKLSEMQEGIDFIKGKEGDIQRAYAERLRKKMEEMLSGREVEEGRILQEVAIFADKVSTDEEITRLQSHIQRMAKLLEEEIPIGRDLDFLLQEMNRESNTILSKANDLSVSEKALKLKNHIEKIREQVQNIE